MKATIKNEVIELESVEGYVQYKYGNGVSVSIELDSNEDKEFHIELFELLLKYKKEGYEVVAPLSVLSEISVNRPLELIDLELK